MSIGAFEAALDFTNRTIVVMGGTGVLGRVLVTALLQTGANLALIVRDAEKALALFPPDVALCETQTGLPPLVERSRPAHPDN